MNMTEVSVVGVIVAKLVGLWWYFRLMKQGKVDPALSTWIILTIITGLSLWTYSNAEHNDFRAGILNTVDVFSNFSVVLALLFLSKHGVRFKKLEQWYLERREHPFLDLRVALYVELFGGYAPHGLLRPETVEKKPRPVTRFFLEKDRNLGYA